VTGGQAFSSGDADAEPARQLSESDEGTASGPELIAVGRVGAPHGMRGAVFVTPWTDAPDARFASGSVLLTQPVTVGPLTVAAMQPRGGRLVVQFTRVNDRTEAERLRGTELLVRAADRPSLVDPDEFYDSDLIGLRAHTVDGRELGPVHDVVHTPGGDHLLLIVEGRQRLVPFVAAIVPNVDIAAGTLVIDPPEGLLEL
jgi:16S rRNA processing protein RimM